MTEDLSDSSWKPRTMVLDPDSITDQQFSLSAMSVMTLLVFRTRYAMSGCSRLRRQRGLRPMRSSAGATPVVERGVMRYWKRKREICVSRLTPPGSFLSVCTALSARPLDAGWYGALVRCLMPLRWTNAANSSLVKAVPLTETITSGNPWVEKTSCSFFEM